MAEAEKQRVPGVETTHGANAAPATVDHGRKQVAQPMHQNPFQEHAEQNQTRNIVGTLLKFSKGDWLAGQENEEIEAGTKMICNMDQLLKGWIRWEGQKPVEQRMGLVVDRYQPASRDQLGHGYKPGMRYDDENVDKSEWEVDGSTGQPRDPWQFSNYIVMKDLAEKDPEEGIYTFATSSEGGKSAITDLCKVYGSKMAYHENEYPVVALKVGSYLHSNKSFGRIKIPVLQVVGWAPKAAFGEELGTLDAMAAAQLHGSGKDEDIPF